MDSPSTGFIFEVTLIDPSMARLSVLGLGLLLLVALCSASLNIEGSSKRVLVLLDNLAVRESHSFYFKLLKGRDAMFSSVG